MCSFSDIPFHISIIIYLYLSSAQTSLHSCFITFRLELASRSLHEVAYHAVTQVLPDFELIFASKDVLRNQLDKLQLPLDIWVNRTTTLSASIATKLASASNLTQLQIRYIKAKLPNDLFETISRARAPLEYAT